MNEPSPVKSPLGRQVLKEIHNEIQSIGSTSPRKSAPFSIPVTDSETDYCVDGNKYLKETSTSPPIPKFVLPDIVNTTVQDTSEIDSLAEETSYLKSSTNDTLSDSFLDGFNTLNLASKKDETIKITVNSNISSDDESFMECNSFSELTPTKASTYPTSLLKNAIANSVTTATAVAVPNTNDSALQLFKHREFDGYYPFNTSDISMVTVCDSTTDCLELDGVDNPVEIDTQSKGIDIEEIHEQPTDPSDPIISGSVGDIDSLAFRTADDQFSIMPSEQSLINSENESELCQSDSEENQTIIFDKSATEPLDSPSIVDVIQPISDLNLNTTVQVTDPTESTESIHLEINPIEDLPDVDKKEVNVTTVIISESIPERETRGNETIVLNVDGSDSVNDNRIESDLNMPDEEASFNMPSPSNESFNQNPIIESTRLAFDETIIVGSRLIVRDVDQVNETVCLTDNKLNGECFTDNFTDNFNVTFKRPALPGYLNRKGSDTLNIDHRKCLSTDMGQTLIVSDDEFQSNGTILTDSDFATLLAKQSATTDDRSSLLLKFDPLFDTGRQSNQLRTGFVANLPRDLSPTVEENSVTDDLHQSIDLNPVELVDGVTETVDLSIVKEQREDGAVEQLESIVDDNVTMNVGFIEDTSNYDDKKSITTINCIKSEEKYSSKMADLEKKIKNEVLKTEDIEKKLKEAEQKEEALLKRITEKDKQISKWSGVIETYERGIAELTSEKAQQKQNYERQIEELKADRDANYHHLMSLESTFSDLHTKYERLKQMANHLKENETGMIEDRKAVQQQLKGLESRYDSMKQHAIQQLDIANSTLDKLTKTHSMDVNKLKASLKKEEVARQSASEQLQQKTKENEELVKICDELINGQGS